MIILLTLIFLISIIAFVVGLISPKTVLRWEQDETEKTRWNVAEYFLTTAVVTFIIIAMVTPSVESIDPEEENQRIVEVAISDSDKEVLLKDYTDLSDDEVYFIGRLRENMDSIKDNSDKHLAIEELSRLKEEEAIETARLEKERQEKEEVEKAERKKKEEEERIAREEQDRIDKEEKDRQEKEKYNTGISWQDMARDKFGLIGSHVRFQGKVLQVISGDGFMQYRMAIDSDYDKVILIQISSSKLDSNIIEDDIITIEGMSLGNVEYTTVMGASQSVPAVTVDNLIIH